MSCCHCFSKRSEWVRGRPGAIILSGSRGCSRGEPSAASVQSSRAVAAIRQGSSPSSFGSGSPKSLVQRRAKMSNLASCAQTVEFAGRTGKHLQHAVIVNQGPLGVARRQFLPGLFGLVEPLAGVSRQ